ncbi:MAG: VCBS repeat-containing protein [Candidatus Zixiibacteriota bacterium]
MHKQALIVFFLVFLAGTSFAQGGKVTSDSIPFAPAINYSVGGHPQSVFCADLDGDGDLDLAVADYSDTSVSILKNNGDGTFQTPVNYVVGTGKHHYSVFCADLDGDKYLDLAVTNYDYNGSVSILKNNGNGTFQSAVNYGAGAYPRSVFCADLDGDKYLDLAVANGDGHVSVLKNNGNGTFQTPVSYGAGTSPNSVFCADLDGDGDLDLAVANMLGSVSVLKNNGDGTFQAAVNYDVVTPHSVFCADLDGDTALDLVLPNSSAKSVSVLKNNGNGTFQTPGQLWCLREPLLGFLCGFRRRW